MQAKEESHRKNRVAIQRRDADRTKVGKCVSHESRKAAIVFKLSLIHIFMVIVSVILGTITLSFLILMNLRDRMFEIGILLSVGETKMRIMLQMLMESFCPVLLAITAGVIFSYPLANVIKIAVDLSNGVQAAIKTQQIIILYLCGMGVVLASSMVMVYQIVRYQPKKILMME